MAAELPRKKSGHSGGEVALAIGYSRPSGTDLASSAHLAVRHGDEYIVNGQKIWTTGGHDANYVWLACRTDPEAAKHKGISILIVDTTDPGYSSTPIILSDRRAPAPTPPTTTTSVFRVDRVDARRRLAV